MNTQAKLRRKLLKTALIGGGVLGASGVTLDRWLTPVIDSVVLPAHAQTSVNRRYSMLDSNYPIHNQAPTGASAALAREARVAQSGSIAETLTELFFASANAAPTQLPASSTARLEMYLERLGENRYQFTFSMTAVESGLILVLFGDEMLQIGNGTIHLALCNGHPKPFPVVLEGVNSDSASIQIAGELFLLGADPAAMAPVKQACGAA